MKVRTDRTLSFYDGDDNPNVNLLRDILLTYSFYNFDLGYCQVISSNGSCYYNIISPWFLVGLKRFSLRLCIIWRSPSNQLPNLKQHRERRARSHVALLVCGLLPFCYLPSLMRFFFGFDLHGLFFCFLFKNILMFYFYF